MAKNNNFLYKLDMLLLSILKYQDCYGYEMIKILKEMSGGIIDSKHGTMYPILYELLENKYITSYNKVVGNKVRVYYHLEDTGKEYLNTIIKEYASTVSAIDKIVYYKEK